MENKIQTNENKMASIVMKVQKQRKEIKKEKSFSNLRSKLMKWFRKAIPKKGLKTYI